MPRIADLWKLQEVDSSLDMRRATLEDAQSRIGESEELIALQALLEEKRAALRAAQAQQHDLEIEANDLKAKIAPAEQKLYSGSVRNPKELQDLQADVDQMKRHLSSIEDNDLAALTALEEAEKEARTVEAQAQALEEAWRAEQAELRETVAALTEEVSRLEAERSQQAASIDADLTMTYDDIRRRHQGKGVAKVDRSICMGCRIALPPMLVNKARSAAGYAQCPNCERILFT